MAYEQKEGSGTIFKNDKKGNEKAPDYRGSVIINGVETEIALWVKDGQKGKFFSVSQKTKQAKVETKSNPIEEDTSDLPF